MVRGIIWWSNPQRHTGERDGVNMNRWRTHEGANQQGSGHWNPATHLRHLLRAFSHSTCVWEHIKQTSPCWCFHMLPVEKWVLWEGSWEGSALVLCALRNQRMGSGLRTTFTLMWQGKGRMLLRWGFQRRGMHYSVETFREHRCKLKGWCQTQLTQSSRRVDIRLCVPAAGRRGLPHPDDSTPVSSLLPFPFLLRHKAANACTSISHFYLFATWSMIHLDGHQMEMNKNGFCTNTPPFFITDLLIPLLSSSKLIVMLSVFSNNKYLYILFGEFSYFPFFVKPRSFLTFLHLTVSCKAICL